MPSETHPEHIRIPHLRPVQPIPVQKDGKQFIALRDPAMLVNQTMVVAPQALQLLQHFRGEQDIDAIAGMFNVAADQVLALAQGLDKLGLLWGPTFEKYEKTLKDEIAKRGAIPVSAAASLGDSAAACRDRISDWLNQTEDPEVEGAVTAVVAPHLDYERGWPNYAAAYRCLERVEAPDRVIILGTNHFGLGDGVVLTEYGFESPMGRCPAARDVIDLLTEEFGPSVMVDQLDHLREHSVQLHIPWIQYRWGNIPVLGCLVPDPLIPLLEDDEERVDHGRFVETLRDAVQDVGGSTVFIASADLSHVGPQFGEPRPVDDQRRHDVESHDREMMGKYLSGDAEEFLAAMRWCNNSTRWCSIGNMTAALAAAQPQSIDLIDYRQACDERGMALVTSAAIAMG